MKTGEVILIPFPFADLTNKKVRPAVVICETKDFYKNLLYLRGKFGRAAKFDGKRNTFEKRFDQ